MEYLQGFNYAEYLKRHLMVGQVDPWRRTDDGKPLYTLLVPVDMAYKECIGWSHPNGGEEPSKTEFLNYLKLNDILSFRNVDEFKQIKEDLKEFKEVKPLKIKKKKISEERRKQLSENMKNVRAHLPVNP